MMPSSAAITSTTMSVTLAPRARMAVKAAWPGVDEGDLRSIMLDAISADVLRDPTGFASRDARLANRVQERGLPMIYVSHERDNGTARLKFLFLFNDRRRRRHDHLFHFVNAGALFAALLFQNEPMILRDLGREVRFDCLVDVCKNVIRH